MYITRKRVRAVAELRLIPLQFCRFCLVICAVSWFSVFWQLGSVAWARDVREAFAPSYLVKGSTGYGDCKSTTESVVSRTRTMDVGSGGLEHWLSRLLRMSMPIVYGTVVHHHVHQRKE